MQPSRGPDTASARRHVRRFLLLSVVVCATLLLTELAHRGWLALRDRPYDAVRVRGDVERLLDSAVNFVPRVDQAIVADVPKTATTSRSVHPFIAWDYTGGVEMIDNELEGVRLRTPEDPFDVLILGGSVAEIFGQQGDEPLAQLLAADPRIGARGVHFFRFGRGGFKQPQQLHFLGYLLSIGFRPDAVLVIDGFNEVALGANNADLGISPIFPSFPHWTFLALAGTTDPKLLDIMVEMRATQRALISTCGRALRLHLYESSVLGKIAVGRANALRREYDEATHRYTAELVARATGPELRGPRRGADLAENLAQSVNCWQEASRMVAAICAARGIAYLQVLQPALHDPQGKVPTEEEKRTGDLHPVWREGVVNGYPMLREAGAQLVREGVPFLDLSAVFNHHAERVFLDSCHFGKHGNRILAEALAPALLARLPR